MKIIHFFQYSSDRRWFEGSDRQWCRLRRFQDIDDGIPDNDEKEDDGVGVTDANGFLGIDAERLYFGSDRAAAFAPTFGEDEITS